MIYNLNQEVDTVLKEKNIQQNSLRSPKANSKSKITKEDNYQTIQKLKKKIAVSRRKLQELWDAKGHTDNAVLEASIELDLLLNLYQKQVKAKPYLTSNSLNDNHNKKDFPEK